MSKITFSKQKSFFERVYEVVAMIPEGKVATYGQIATILGNPKAARQVGYAMAKAPLHLNLPCHRVVNRTGVLAPDFVFNGKDFQHALLENEGITFIHKDRIDLEKHLWDFNCQLDIT